MISCIKHDFIQAGKPVHNPFLHGWVTYFPWLGDRIAASGLFFVLNLWCAPGLTFPPGQRESATGTAWLASNKAGVLISIWKVRKGRSKHGQIADRISAAGGAKPV